MKFILIVFLSILCGCGGTFWLTPNGHRAFYQSADGQLSCYTDNCCYPYKEKAMICTTAGINNMAVAVKVMIDK